MKLTPKLVNQIIAEIVGEEALPIVEYLKGKKNISEFQIAQALKLEVNYIRNILYRLHTHNLITYHRKKDKIKGWYISYWTLNLGTIKHVWKKVHEERLERFKERLKREEENRNAFFICSNLCVRTDLDQATELNFRCPECGKMMNQLDNQKTIENLKKKIDELEKKIAELEA